MRIVKPSAKLLKKENFSPCEFVEKIARTCYKSEGGSNTSQRFVRGLINRQHYAMLEHYNIILALNYGEYSALVEDSLGELVDFKYIKRSNVSDANLFIMSGSIRAWRDLFLKRGRDVGLLLLFLNTEFPVMFEDVVEKIYGEYVPDYHSYIKEYGIEPGVILSERELANRLLAVDAFELFQKHVSITMKIVCDRGVSHELVRHRLCAFAQESTRYCNYSRDTFDKQISVISPFGDYPSVGNPKTHEQAYWEEACLEAERSYFKLLKEGVTPQMARSVLPTSLKTEIVVTANYEEWKHIFDLRLKGTTGAPHPQMKEVMELVYDVFKENWITAIGKGGAF